MISPYFLEHCLAWAPSHQTLLLFLLPPTTLFQSLSEIFLSIQTQGHIFSLDTLLFISSVYFLYDHLPSHGFISNLHLQDRPLPWDLDLYTQLPSHPLHSNIKHTCQSKISKTNLDFLLKPASPPSFTLSKWEHHPHSYLDPKFRPCCWFLYKHTPHSHHFIKFSPPSVYVPNLNSSLPPLLPT